MSRRWVLCSPSLLQDAVDAEFVQPSCGPRRTDIRLRREQSPYLGSSQVRRFINVFIFNSKTSFNRFGLGSFWGFSTDYAAFSSDGLRVSKYLFLECPDHY